jgi:flagellar assembly protein FliH
MRCRIADAADLAQPVAWRSVTPGLHSTALHPAPPPADLVRTPSRASGPPAGPPAESIGQAELAQARQSGFEDGLRRGRDEAAAPVGQTLDRLAETLRELAQMKRKIRNEAEQELVTLSLAIARRILYRELSTDPDSIHGIVHAALQKLHNREIIRVRVYPAAAAAVRTAFERMTNSAAVEIVADTALETGAILFETSLGDLDASVETQLQEIQRGFADRLIAK